MPYLKIMPGLSTSELAMVVFILALVTVAGRLPRWGEALGSYLYRRRNGQLEPEAPASHDDAARGTPERGTSSQAPPPS